MFLKKGSCQNHVTNSVTISVYKQEHHLLHRNFVFFFADHFLGKSLRSWHLNKKTVIFPHFETLMTCALLSTPEKMGNLLAFGLVETFGKQERKTPLVVSSHLNRLRENPPLAFGKGMNEPRNKQIIPRLNSTTHYSRFLRMNLKFWPCFFGARFP